MDGTIIFILLIIAQLIFYMIRWQLSTFTLGPVISWRKWKREKKINSDAKLVLFNKTDLGDAFWGNVVGSLLFFPVDMFIFNWLKGLLYGLLSGLF